MRSPSSNAIIKRKLCFYIMIFDWFAFWSLLFVLFFVFFYLRVFFFFYFCQGQYVAQYPDGDLYSDS